MSDWVGKLNETGLHVTPIANSEFQKEMNLDTRIETIKKILNDGRTLAKNVAEVAESIYYIIRPLYDPSLPEEKVEQYFYILTILNIIIKYIINN